MSGDRTLQGDEAIRRGLIEWTARIAEAHDLSKALDHCELKAADILQQGGFPLPRARDDAWMAEVAEARGRLAKARTWKAKAAAVETLNRLREEESPTIPREAAPKYHLAMILLDQVKKVRQQLAPSSTRDTDITLLRIGELSAHLGFSSYDPIIQRGRIRGKQKSKEIATRNADIRKRSEDGESPKSIAAMYGMKVGTVRKIINDPERY